MASGLKRLIKYQNERCKLAMHILDFNRYYTLNTKGSIASAYDTTKKVDLSIKKGKLNDLDYNKLFYASQVIEIHKLSYYCMTLSNIYRDSRTTDETKSHIRMFEWTCDKALKIYASKLDAADFDGEVEELNKFLSSHIVKKGFHYEFQIVTKQDIKTQQLPYETIKKSNLETVENMKNSFDKILNNSKNKEAKTAQRERER